MVLQWVILLHFKVKLPSPSLKYYLVSVVLQWVILLHFKVKLPSPSLKYYLVFCVPVWLGWLHSYSSSLNSSDANMLLSPSVTCLSTWHIHFLICLNLGQDYASLCFWTPSHFTLRRAPADDSICCAIQQSHHSAWSQSGCGTLALSD